MDPRPTVRLSKENRLRDAASFDRVFDRANRSRDRWFTVLSRSNELERARLGLAISKKNCKTAVGRNRIKRIVRESFRHHQDTLAGLDVVVMSKGAAESAANNTLFASLEAHWERCGRQRPVGN